MNQEEQYKAMEEWAKRVGFDTGAYVALTGAICSGYVSLPVGGLASDAVERFFAKVKTDE